MPADDDAHSRWQPGYRAHLGARWGRPAGDDRTRRPETLRRIDGQGRWESERQGDTLVLRRKLRSDNATLMARAMEGDATIYEGTQTPTTGMTIHYILGWTHEERGVGCVAP